MGQSTGVGHLNRDVVRLRRLVVKVGPGLNPDLGADNFESARGVVGDRIAERVSCVLIDSVEGSRRRSPHPSSHQPRRLTSRHPSGRH